MLLESALAMSLQVEKMRVDIETVSSLTAGQTVCDIWHMSPLPANATVARVCLALLHLTIMMPAQCSSGSISAQEMDVDQFWQMQIEAFHAADACSPMNT